MSRHGVKERIQRLSFDLLFLFWDVILLFACYYYYYSKKLGSYCIYLLSLKQSNSYDRLHPRYIKYVYSCCIRSSLKISQKSIKFKKISENCCFICFFIVLCLLFPDSFSPILLLAFFQLCPVSCGTIWNNPVLSGRHQKFIFYTFGIWMLWGQLGMFPEISRLAEMPLTVNLAHLVTRKLPS